MASLSFFRFLTDSSSVAVPRYSWNSLKPAVTPPEHTMTALRCGCTPSHMWKMSARRRVGSIKVMRTAKRVFPKPQKASKNALRCTSKGLSLIKASIPSCWPLRRKFSLTRASSASSSKSGAISSWKMRNASEAAFDLCAFNAKGLRLSVFVGAVRVASFCWRAAGLTCVVWPFGCGCLAACAMACWIRWRTIAMTASSSPPVCAMAFWSHSSMVPAFSRSFPCAFSSDAIQ